jgi:antitoxin component YwqK of YwqJK toxin-antitoxin module
MQCKAIAKSTGAECKCNAVIDGYCTQHYNILNKNIEGNKSPKKLLIREKYEIDSQNQELIPDLMKNIISDYIEYDELKNLESKIENLKINPNRIEIKETFHLNGNIKKRNTYIDDDLRKEESFDETGKKYFEYNFKNGKENGIQKMWYRNGKLAEDENYINGEKNGIQKYYNEDGRLIIEENYKNNKKDGTQKYYNDIGILVDEYNYKNGKKHAIQKYYNEN